MTAVRKKDSYSKYIQDFVGKVYVECPSCLKQAIVSANQQSIPEIRLVCPSCGHNKTLAHRTIVLGQAVDPYFQLPLWLTQNCCDNILWAYNYEHLDFVKQHIEARLRERNTTKMSNQSLGSRLPRWMTLKKNRQSVLKAIDQLYRKK